MFVSILKPLRMSLESSSQSWLRCGLTLLGIFLMDPLQAEGFDFDELDPGKSVTLPHPATTFVSLPNSVIVTSTDRGQSLKLQASARSQQANLRPFRVSIYDPNAERVRHVNVVPGQPVLYNFKSLGSIRLTVSLPEGVQTEANVRLQLESNRPLEIRKGGSEGH